MIDRQQLLKDLQRELPKLEKDILAYSEQSAERTAHLKQEYAKAKEAGRTAEHFVSWREAQITQAAVAWVLTCVFVRFLEDNGLLAQPVLSGPVERESDSNTAKTYPLKNAKDRIEAYFNEHPTHAEREYLLHLFEQLEQIPVIAELLDHRHNPLWQIPVSADGAKSLIDFFQKIDPETGHIIHDFTDPNWDTRFLGDLYQDLSEAVRKRYALLQTPEFVESFILDYTLEPAIKTFGLEGLRLIDPTCGSGHFLLTTFERIFGRWQKREPGTNSRMLAQRALDVVHGVDINPYAIAICRFRLLMAAMKACEIELIKDAPAFQFNLACGDSLLHGKRFEWQGQGIQQGLLDDELRHFLEVEDLNKINKILGQQYHVVVGNPPYITVKDKQLNQAYRTKYFSCHMKYSLGVPFTERFVELSFAKSENSQPGYFGLITANSFMKREFGKKIIEQYFPQKNITHIIDVAGAYIPGHGTPTVILFGKNEKPNNENVKVVMGVSGEPKTPEYPEKGVVWSSIVENIGKEEFDGPYIGVAWKSRSQFKTHPWSLSGGGAIELKQYLDTKGHRTLWELATSIGYMSFPGADDIFVFPEKVLERHGAPARTIKKLVFGESLRDWISSTDSYAFAPYDEHFLGLNYADLGAYIRQHWRYRTNLENIVSFGGKTRKQLNESWWTWYRWISHKYETPLSISFAEVASHNHFALFSNDYVFNATAPVIKLKNESSVKDHLLVLAFLNSSTACFWMKQVCHQKQMTGGDGVRIESRAKVPYQFASTALKKIPIPKFDEGSEEVGSFLNLCELISQTISDINLLSPDRAIDDAVEKGMSVSSALNHYLAEKAKLNSRLILCQEEVDWRIYYYFGLNEDLSSDVKTWNDVSARAGERPFEILKGENIDGFEVPAQIPNNWPEDLQEIWRKRIEAIKTSQSLSILEDPHYKRRWVGRQGLFNHSAKNDEIKGSCKKWLLNRIESISKERQLISVSQISDLLRNDKKFHEVATVFSSGHDFDHHTLISNLISEEHVPQISSAILKPVAVNKYRAWQETWDKQRLEDTIDIEFEVDKPLFEDDAADENKRGRYEDAKRQAVAKKAKMVGDIPVPPQYKPSDFRKASYWQLRGKLDVSKERFFSLPGCEKDGDNTLVIGWAGLNHLQRAQAIAAWYEDRKENDGWEAERLMLMLVAIDELIPWLKQWHNDIDPEYGERMGDFYESYLLEELRRWELTREELLDWRPPMTTRRRR